MSFQYKGKVCVVTGGASGIGRAIALGYGRYGASVQILDKDCGKAEKVANEVTALGSVGKAYCVDITDSRQVSYSVCEITEEFKKIDILVGCAGYHELIPFLDLTDECFDRMIDVHLKGTYNTIKAVIPHMVKQQSGKIIVISSVAGKVGSGVGASHYAAAKGGILALTKSLAREFGPLGIQINAITPGLIDTPMIAPIKDSALQAYVKGLPLGRIGQPEDVVGLALFLGSEENNFITGQGINVCGGYLMI